MASKQRTIQDHRQRINRVLIYIQQHADEELTLEALAGVACLSDYHFHRIFAAHVGEPLGEYIRRTRLEKAASWLCHSNKSVTRIALDAGYDTPAAFSRAFRERFGLAPRDFRIEKKSYILSELQLDPANLRKGNSMQVKTVTLPDQKVLFVRKTGSYAEAAPPAWEGVCSFVYSRKLINADSRMIGLCHDDPDITDAENIRYDACVTIDQEVTPEGEVGCQTIAGGRYAVFLHKGPYEGLKETYQRIYGEWLQSGDEQLRDCPCFELYLNRDPRRTKPENLKTEIYIPLI